MSELFPLRSLQDDPASLVPKTPSREEIYAKRLAAMDPTEFMRQLATGVALNDYKIEHAAELWVPVPKQLEFFELTKTKRECALFAGNQEGKTTAGAFMVGCHLTGIYPDWWNGRRWDRPVEWWASGESATSVRDIGQAKLFGKPGSPEMLGTGMIPRDLIVGQPSANHSAPGGFDTAMVRHVTGGISRIAFKTYEMDPGKWQGTTLDGVWYDEEPPTAHYTEGLARTTATNGLCILTFTPLKGYKQVVPRFLRMTTDIEREFRGYVKMGLKDALWYTDEERRRIEAQYPEHERAARINGEPFLGSGAVFYGINEENLYCQIPLSAVPGHWYKLWALDFGIGHPFAACLLAWDKDADTIYVLHTIRVANLTPVQHAASMRAIDANAAVAWPHDGHDRDKGSGLQLSKTYADQGLNMMATHAQFAEGGYSTEAGVSEMISYMEAGRFKVNRWLSDWFDEFRSYYRDKGLIVKSNDDLMSATRVGVMQRRSARMGAIANQYVERMHNPTRLAITSADPWSGV